MATLKDQEILFSHIEKLRDAQPLQLSVKDILTVCTNKQDRQQLVDAISAKNPTYVSLIEFPNMDADKMKRGAYALIEEFSALKDNMTNLKFNRLHLDVRDLNEGQLNDLAAHVGSLCADHELPDITCDTGDMKLNGTWNTIIYGFSSGKGVDDMFGAYAALGDTFAALRKFDDMRLAYDFSIAASESDEQKAEAFFLRGHAYRDFAIMDATQLKQRLYSYAIEDIRQAHALWPENANIKQTLGGLYFERGMFYLSHRGSQELQNAIKDFNQADQMFGGKNDAVRQCLQMCEERVREVRELDQSFAPGDLCTSAILNRKQNVPRQASTSGLFKPGSDTRRVRDGDENINTSDKTPKKP